ncbi:MAG TPA: DUF932 domain-containing protein [Bacteroidia bacterium]|nr:DUF932 domain-containing protein [Bacteroidia bacterium]
MSNEQLWKEAPSIFATEPWERMSERYTFIPTIQIVDKMRSEGFVPVSAVQSRTRIPGKGDFTKHAIRFRDMRQGDSPLNLKLGTLYPELLLTNAHDGSSAHNLDAALWRLACLNGLVVADSTVARIHQVHKGSVDDILEASFEVIEQFPKVLESVESFSQKLLTAPQQTAYADSALALRYDEGEAPVSAEQIIRPRRYEDKAPTLWNTFNVVQEHLTQGGPRGRNPHTNRRVKVRAVTGIGENTRLNKSLWQLTEAMAKLV